jgi:hypothetical protein
MGWPKRNCSNRLIGAAEVGEFVQGLGHLFDQVRAAEATEARGEDDPPEALSVAEPPS